MQGLTQTKQGDQPNWKIFFPTEKKWANPLMGWTSTGDALENNARYLHFPSRESAVAFAEKNNWPYEVEEPNPVSTARPLRYQGYGDNFSVKRKGLPVGGLRSEQLEAAAPQKEASKEAPKPRGKKAAAKTAA
ncbi:hypothetical protein H632_c211p1 [Helicosporidium sp. ATCC 50920]|nr:hypothetical protein H632_c211p1 [Helicosporidium sp. ATCC 50920]|eukprot:KDD76480.1 hypothetical protein H632_c211p1 [Helicosporidium sp. ATCC 50920]